jgi:hypothetical protein
MQHLHTYILSEQGMMAETEDAAALGRSQPWRWRALASLADSAGFHWRLRTRGTDASGAAHGRDTSKSVRTKRRATAGITVLFVLMGIAPAAIAVGATVGHRIPGRLVAASTGSGRRAGGSVFGSAIGNAPRSGSAAAATSSEHVDLFGDSLGYQAEPYLDMFFAQTHHYTVSDYTYGGTATCDWLSRMAAAAAEQPQAAILVFSGDAFTSCMDGVALGSLQYYDLYATYTERAIRIFSAVGAHVFLVGTPVDEFSATGWVHLDDIYRHLARADPLTVTYVDAAISVETATGGFTWSLPCMSIEPTCAPDGTNVVRSPDGIHFCPDGAPATRGVIGPCDQYSSGAFRFALAIARAVTQDAPSSAEDGVEIEEQVFARISSINVVAPLNSWPRVTRTVH